MSGQEGLGRLFNVVQPADDVYISLKNCSGVTFIVFEVDGATSVTISTAEDAAGTGVATGDLIDHFYGSSADQSNGVWHKTTQTASEVVQPADGTEDMAAIYVSGEMLPAGHNYVKANADAGTVVAIMHDLTVQRNPANLVSPRV